jgi:hypothetical protein
MHPADAILSEDLLLRPQLGFVQVEVVHSADPKNAFAWESLTNTVHQRTARKAEVVGHELARGDSISLTICFQVVPATDVLQISVVDGEVGSEHRRCDLATICAIANKG